MRIPYTLLRKLIMPLADKAMGTSISKYWEKIPKMNQWSRSEIRQWQSDRFKELVKDAYENTTYYRKLMDKMDLSPNDIKSIDDVKLFPVLTKELIKQNFSDMISKNADRIKHKISHTGGSTGDPLRYIQSHEAWGFANANTIVNWEKTGYRYGDPYLTLGSTSINVGKKLSLKHSIYYGIKNKHTFSGVNMTDENMDDCLEYLEKKNIRYIYGYASAIYMLAQHASTRGFGGKISCCFPTAEVLQDVFYQTIKKSLNCDILNGYGAHDGSITAFSLNGGLFEVGYNTYAHIDHQQNDLENSVLLTDLFSSVFPLINYMIGDQVRLGDTKIEYNGQTIQQVLGRTSELLEFDNGSRITGPGFTTIFKDLPVEYFCIEKKTSTELVCHIIKDAQYDHNTEEHILEGIRRRVGEGVLVSINYTDKPFLAKSGKRVYVLDGCSR